MRVPNHAFLIMAAAAIGALACASPTAAHKALVPESTASSRQFTRIAAGFVHTCALDASGAAYCWGNNDYSQLGVENGALRFTDIGAGWVHNCGIVADGRIWCWGGGADDKRGYLGDGTLRRSVNPVLVAADSLFSSVTLGDGHSCALTRSGAAFCWGDNDWGQLGDGSRIDRATPVAAAAGLRFRTLSAGAYHTCGVTADNTALCWGDNRWGQLGSGDVAYNSMEAAQSVPVPVAGGAQFHEIVAGWEHSCGITVAGVTQCWGRNEFARQLGDESAVTHRGVPQPIAASPVFTTLTAGALSTCGRTASGETYCWGGNYYGTLGDGTSTSSGVGRPVRTQGGPFTDIAIGQSHACGLAASDRTLWCWGDRSAGQF